MWPVSYTHLDVYKRQTQKGLAFILPSFAGVCIFWLIPYVDVICRSFCGAVNGEFVGIENLSLIHI